MKKVYINYNIFYLDDKTYIIELLLQHGVDIDTATADKENTALHIATSMGKIHIPNKIKIESK